MQEISQLSSPCLDVDECAEMSTAGQQPCSDSGAVCVNTPGSYHCTEPPRASCEEMDPVSGQCVNVGPPGFCQLGMRFDSTAAQCVGNKTK